MRQLKKASGAPEKALQKVPTGIQGLDEITLGGLPRGRATLLCGSAGAGKTLLATEFLVRGAKQFDEPGVLMAFEETGEDLAMNFDSLGFDLPGLGTRRRVLVDYVHVERSEIRETGEFTLDGLFARLGYAIDSIGARRVVLDSLETVFEGLRQTGILRAEIRRLIRWLKDRGVTAVITAERGDGALTRHGFEEYISDCVILLDHRVHNQVATRRLRVVKYRGSAHGSDEYPLMMGATGLSVLPATSLTLSHSASAGRISTGIPRLDTMLGGKGYFRGSSILASGAAGSGKTSLAAHLADAACARGERCLMFLFEESSGQLIRNMRSIGIRLDRWVREGLLQIYAARPTLCGLEAHLLTIHDVLRRFEPEVVVIDPVTNLSAVGTMAEVRSMLTRLIDHLKQHRVTAFFTSLTQGDAGFEGTDIGVSSLMDTWLQLRDFETNGERNRLLYVLKSRGMAHSNQVREFQLTNQGVRLLNVYVGPGGVLTGTARMAQEVREKAENRRRLDGFRQQKRELTRRRVLLDAQLEAARQELKVLDGEKVRVEAEEKMYVELEASGRSAMALARGADAGRSNGASPDGAKSRKGA